MAAFSLGDGLAIIVETLPKKAYELRKIFVASPLLLRRLPEEARPTPTSRETADVLAEGFDLAVDVFEFPDEAAAAAAWDALVAAFAAHGIDVASANADSESFNAPALVLKDAAVEERVLDEDDVKDNYLAAFRPMISADCRMLANLSRATGQRVRYCMGRYITQPPLPFEEGVVNVMIGLRPPGNYREFSVKVRELFGRKVWSDGEERMVHGPVQWRGRTISAEGVPVFQVIGNCYYQTILIHTEHGNGYERTALWNRMLALLARDLIDGPPADAAAHGPIDVEAAVVGMAGKREDDLRDKLRKLEFELGDLQKQYAEKLRKRDEKVALLKDLRRETSDLAERCGRDVKAIEAMEDVTAVRIDADDGLLVETVPIALTHEGRRYDLGPFRIHIGSGGDIAVWSESPRHPKGHHHPHVDRVSLQCLGNVTLAVTKLTSGYRFADAVTMIVRWLRSYRPETTLIPLEEFPSEPVQEAKGAARAEKDRAQLLPAASPAGPESRPPGHADRRRVDRKPRGRRARQDGRA